MHGQQLHPAAVLPQPLFEPSDRGLVVAERDLQEGQVERRDILLARARLQRIQHVPGFLRPPGLGVDVSHHPGWRVPHLPPSGQRGFHRFIVTTERTVREGLPERRQGVVRINRPRPREGVNGHFRATRQVIHDSLGPKKLRRPRVSRKGALDLSKAFVGPPDPDEQVRQQETRIAFLRIQRLGPASDQAYVLEYSTNFLAGAAGRLLRVDGVRGTSLVIADGLRSPTSLATDTRTGDLFVTEFFANRVMRVLVPK